VSERREEIADVLRQRVLRGLHAGALRPGDRLPSARELERDFDADHRVVLAAYRQLAAEGLVELRQRGGIYVASQPSDGAVPAPPETWLVDVVAQGVAREVPLPELHEWLRRATGTVRLRAAVVASTADQATGIERELCDDYGIDSVRVDPATLHGAGSTGAAPEAPASVRHADLLVTTQAHAERVEALAGSLGKPCVVTTIRPDLVGAEWRLLLKRPVYVLVADARFLETLRHFFAETPGAENLRPLVVGRDDLAVVPEGAPVYVTRSAREALGDTPIRGQVLPTARVFSAEAARALITFVVRANLDAITARRR